MDNFKIVLYQTSEQQAYRPGETISGAVEFTLTEPKCYNCIKVDFLGSAHVEWGGKIHYLSDELYVQDSCLLWSPQHGNGSSIGPGSLSFPFQFVIPSHVPSSFHQQNTSLFNNSSAHITYELEARAVTGMLQLDHKALTPITITRPTSINGANQVKPIQQVKRKQVGCLCCAAGDVEFIAKLPRTGYCVTNGDVIPLTVDVQNSSSRVIHMRAILMKKVVMFVRAEENASSEKVAEIFSEPIQPGASYIWNPTNWIVPALPPTLLGCRIIHVDYNLEVSAIIPKSLTLDCRIPLVMGNLPYTQSSGNLDHALLGAIVNALVQGRTSATARRGNEEDINDYYNSNDKDTLI